MSAGPARPDESLNEWVKRVVDDAPAMTPEQAERVTALLFQGTGPRYRGYTPCPRCGKRPTVRELREGASETWPEHECPGPPDLRR